LAREFDKPNPIAMTSVRLYRNNEVVKVPLREYILQFHFKINPAWNEYLIWINEGMNIQSTEDYNSFIKKLNLNGYDFKRMKVRFDELRKNRILVKLDNDVLKFISHLYELGYFERIGNPELLGWLNTKGIFEPKREQIPQDEMFSILELLKFEYGLNAVKNHLLFALKW
jgi:hypothetical protein